jgi:hypothetical protein
MLSAVVHGFEYKLWEVFKECSLSYNGYAFYAFVILSEDN